MREERDVWNTTNIHRVIRRRIGESLSAGYDLSKSLPDGMQTLLDQLDKPSAADATERGHPRCASNSR
jgi:hypothetical protein